MKHVIPLPSKGYVSVMTGNDLKFINPQKPHKIWILYRVLDEVMDLKLKRKQMGLLN